MRVLRIAMLYLLAIPAHTQTDSNFMVNFQQEGNLKTENQLEKYSSYDFSNLWTYTPNQYVYGIIGSNHQRLRMKLLTIERNPFDTLEYVVTGKSLVKEHVCDFVGVIRLKAVQEVQELHYGVDDERKNDGIQAQGVLVAAYTFREHQDQRNSGSFSGMLYTKWFLDAGQQIRYDDIQSLADGYTNNAFVGTWQGYGSDRAKVCNWGDYRVPLANHDFDIGAGEFNVSEKYREAGWSDIGQPTKPATDSSVMDNTAQLVREWWKQR